jgi:hypothetical protein
MCPMSDVTVLGWLFVTDLGQAMPPLITVIRGQKFGRLQTDSRWKPRLFADETPNTALPNHIISSICAQSVMSQCWDGSVWLILDRPST